MEYPETLNRQLHKDPLTEAVLHAFLKTGQACDVPAISKQLGRSTSTVYKLLRDAGGVPRDCTAHPSSHGNGWYYLPRPEILRKVVLDLAGTPHASAGGDLCTEGTDGCCTVCDVTCTPCDHCTGVGYHRPDCCETDREDHGREPRDNERDCYNTRYGKDSAC